MSKGTVIVIDDSFTVRKLVEAVLTEDGYKVYTAEDGEEGLKLAEEIKPSLILVDFVMPKMSGYQFCALAKESRSISSIPIILITAKGEEVGEVFTEKFGVKDYFIKPFEPEELVLKINSILQQSVPGTALAETSAASEKQDAEATQPAEVEQTLDLLVSRYFKNELPLLLRESVSDVLRHEGLSRASGIMLSGDLSEFRFFDIFRLIAQARPTGRLSVFSAALSSEMYIDHGDIVYAFTSRQGRGLLSGELIKDKFGVAADAFSRVCREARQKNISLPKAFIATGVLSQEKVEGVIRRIIDEAVYSSMTVENGNFYFEKADLPAGISDVQYRMNASEFIIEGARRLAETKFEADWMEATNSIPFRIMTEKAVLELKLGSDEMKMLLLVDGKRTIGDIIKMSGIDGGKAQKIIFVLAKTGILRNS